MNGGPPGIRGAGEEKARKIARTGRNNVASLFAKNSKRVVLICYVEIEQSDGRKEVMKTCDGTFFSFCFSYCFFVLFIFYTVAEK